MSVLGAILPCAWAGVDDRDMNRRLVIDLVRVALVSAVGVIALVQAFFLPWLSGELARDLPAEAYVRWPILGLAVTGLLCVQVGVVCVVALLTRVRADRFFAEQSLRWVDGLTTAFAAGGAVCAATLAYQSQTVSGPPLWALLLLAGLGAGGTLALVTWVGRTLLVEAIACRDDMLSAAPHPPGAVRR